MKKLVYILVTVLLVLTACTGTSRHPQLVAADSLLLTRPDSALTLLRSMSFSSTADRMYHYLLLADACNKCYDTLPSDSILQKVADYYDRHGSANEQVRAHYLLGCAYRDMGEAPQALQCYQDAVDCADTTAKDCNYSTLCRIHAQTAGLFIKQYMPEEAITELDKAIKFTLLANDTLASLYCYENKLGVFYQAGAYDSVLANTAILYRKYWDMRLYDRAASCLSPAIFVLIHRRQLLEAKRYIDIYESHSKRDGNQSNKQGMYYTYLGYYHLYNHRLDSATYYFWQQIRYKEKINNRVLAYHGLFETYQRANQKDSALKYAALYNEANDSTNVFESADRLQRMQSMFRYERNQKRAALSEQEAEKNRYRMWMAIGTGTIVLFLVIQYYRQIRMEEKRRTAEINQRYNVTLELLARSKEDLSLIRQENKALIQKKEEEIDNYKNLLHMYEPDVAVPEKYEDFITGNLLLKSLHKKASSGKPASDKDMQEVYGIIHEHFPKFIEEIEVHVGKLTYKQSQLCVLTKLYFIPSEISTLLQMKYQAVSNMRSRMAKTWLGTEAKTSDLDHLLHPL